jgi:hypothetical protein
MDAYSNHHPSLCSKASAENDLLLTIKGFYASAFHLFPSINSSIGAAIGQLLVMLGYYYDP